jgi:hypothetical protein
MALKNYPETQFRSDIADLIAEIETCLGSAPTTRESDLQREAFHERSHQARTLAGRLTEANRSEWFLRSGDAYRIQESLKLSLAYFRNHPLT